MSKSDNEHDQKQEHKSSVYEFFVSFPSLEDDTNCSEEIPVAERSASQRPAPDFQLRSKPPGVSCLWMRRAAFYAEVQRKTGGT